QLIADLERLHHFVLAELVLQEFLEFVERKRRGTLLQLDEGFRRLAAVLVSDTDYRHLLDRRVLVDRLLENARIDVEAAAQQHVLGSVDDENEAVLIHVADIACAQETTERRHLARRFRPVLRSLHHIWALDADFSALATRDILLRVINAEELDDDTGHRHSAGSDLAHAVLLGRCEGAGWRGLGHAPAFAQVTAGDRSKLLRDLKRQRRPARAAIFERAQAVPGSLGMVDQRGEHRRHTAEDAYPFRRDILKRGLWIEAHVLNNLCSLENSEQYIHRERIDVEWWKHRKEVLLTFGKHRRRAGGRGPVLLARAWEIGVGKHRALRQTCRPAGILKHGNRLGRIGGGIGLEISIVVEQFGEADVAVVPYNITQLSAGLHLGHHRVGMGAQFGQVSHHQFLQPRLAEHCRHLRIERCDIERDEEVGAAVLDLVLQHRGGVERRVVDLRAAGLQHGEKRDDVVRRVRQIQADMDAWLHAKLL